jgi:hypothetical protein
VLPVVSRLASAPETPCRAPRSAPLRSEPLLGEGLGWGLRRRAVGTSPLSVLLRSEPLLGEGLGWGLRRLTSRTASHRSRSWAAGTACTRGRPARR